MAQVFSLTGPIRVGGGCILAFKGPPDRSVEWVIKDGGGTLLPYNTYTDAMGRALCRYEHDGTSSFVVVGVTFVP